MDFGCAIDRENLIKLPVHRDGVLVGWIKTSARQMAKCPKCDGLGMATNPTETRQDLTCEMCHGGKFVPLEVCPGCGRPAWQEWVISFCGREECGKIAGKMLQDAKERYEKEKREEEEFDAQTWYGLC